MLGVAAIFMLASSNLHSQGIEDLYEAAGDDPSIRYHFESLEEHPIDLNSASAEQLQEALLLDPLQVRAIIQHRDRHYPFTTTKDILKVPGISSEIYRELEPYIRVAPVSMPFGTNFRLLSRGYRRYPHSRGYSEGVYHGNPIGVSHSIVLSQGNMMWGGVVQKDPGESHWDDFESLFVRADGILAKEDRWVIGSYRLGFGQGLVLSNGFRMSSTTADPEAILPRQPLGVREYYSTGEFGYFQGVAVQNRFEPLSVGLFVSRVFLDASAEDDSAVGTIQTSGLHRTTSEEANRNQLCEDLWGGHCEVSSGIVTIGVTGYRANYQPSISEGDPITQHFRFSGAENSVVGMNGSAQLGNGGIDGEIAVSESGGKALLIEGKYAISQVQTSCIYHRYDRDFQNMYAVTLTEWGEEAQNEEGWLLALSTPLWQGATMASRTDITRTPWRTYSFPFSRHGAGSVVALDQSLGSGHSVAVRFRGSRIDDLEQDAIVQEVRSAVRAQWDWEASGEQSYRLRWERVRFDTPTSLESGTGWMGYGQVTFGKAHRFSTKFRVVAFDVPAYGARICAYEDDLPGRLVNQLFYGSGRRLTCCLKWTFAPGWNFWLKTGVTSYDGVDVVGSGWDEIPSNHTYDLGAALEWKRTDHRR
jgi:hypothetical protein